MSTDRKAKLEKALAPSLPNDTIRFAEMAWGIQCHSQRLEPLHAALIQAVEALEFYGNIDNWIDDKFRPREDVELSNYMWNDPSGKKAREALAKLDKAIDHQTKISNS